jgi:lipopolysaccharide transport system ATP-binding protein
LPTSSDAAVEVREISKEYRLGETKAYGALRDQMTSGFRRLIGRESKPRETIFWALRDVSFDVPRGSVFGIIGRNGAGKSTLLKVLSRITEPTSGEARLYGRVASLLEVGTGFHPELTGRENVYLNGSILGMSRKEIRARFDEIVAFAEIEKFLDTPVKRYSSGMYVRLAFAVAAHLDPDILLVDEVLAVGDAAFQRKCLGKIESVSEEGRTVVLVSHNMNIVGQLCSNVVWLRSGEVRAIGNPTKVITEYLAEGREAEVEWAPAEHDPRRPLRFHSVSLVRDDQTGGNAFAWNMPVRIELDFTVEKPIPPSHVALHVLMEDGQLLFNTVSSDNLTHLNHELPTGRHRYRCTIPGGLLRPGRYFLSMWEPAGHRHVHREGILSFTVTDEHNPGARHGQYGLIAPVFEWQLD